MSVPLLSRHSFIACGTNFKAYSYTFLPFILINLIPFSYSGLYDSLRFKKSASSALWLKAPDDNIPPDDSLYSSTTAPAPSLKIMLSLSYLSMTLDNVSVPTTKAFLAMPALKKASACITASIHPGQPNNTSNAIHAGLRIPNLCFTLLAKEGTASDCVLPMETSPKL